MKSDIILDNHLRLQGTAVQVESGKAEFKAASNKPTAVHVKSSTTGTGLLEVRGGTNSTDCGIAVEDANGNHLIKLTTQAITKTKLSKTRIFFDGTHGNAILGGYGRDGDLILRNHRGMVTAHISASAGIDGNTVNYNVDPNASLRINAELGQYDLGGALGGTLRVHNNKNETQIALYGKTGKGQFKDISIGDNSQKISNLHAFLLQLRADLDQVMGR